MEIGDELKWGTVSLKKQFGNEATNGSVFMSKSLLAVARLVDVCVP
jgi:hypothetical protein